MIKLYLHLAREVLNSGDSAANVKMQHITKNTGIESALAAAMVNIRRRLR